MKKDARRELAVQIINLVGGKENVSNIIHCMTRLRFTIKDQSKVKIDEISELNGVIGAQWSNEQFQIIIGQWVSDLYKDVVEVADLRLKSTGDDVTSKKKFGVGSIIDAISGCLAPVIPVVVGAGMIKVVLILATMFNLLDASSSTYFVLNFASDAGFYFLPVFLGAFAANKFKTNMPLGMMMGAILLHPSFSGSVAAGEALSIFGLPIYATTYANSIFPIIMAVFLMSYVERFFSKIVPVAVKVIFVPLLTILVMLPVALCIVGPAGAFLGVYLAQAIMWLYSTTGFFGVAVLSAIYPLLVITGMHGALFPPMMQSLTTLGYEPIIGLSGVISNINQGAATLAVAVKNKNERSTAISATVTAILGGVTEPAMFGINLKYKTPLYATMIGSFVGGAVAGIFKVYMYALGGSAGIFGVTGFIGETSSNIMYLFLAILVGFATTFIITLIIYKTDPKQSNKKDTNTKVQSNHKTTVLNSPLDGKVVALEDVQDTAFSSKSIGDGIAVIPTEGVLYAPVDSEVVMIYKSSKHALGLMTSDGIEILIHIGINTVNLGGKFFEVLVEEGTKVKSGEALVKFDLKSIVDAGYDPTTMILFTSQPPVDFTVVKNGAINAFDALLEIK